MSDDHLQCLTAAAKARRSRRNAEDTCAHARALRTWPDGAPTQPERDGAPPGQHQPQPSLSWLYADSPPVEADPRMRFHVDCDGTTAGAVTVRVSGDVDVASSPRLERCLRNLIADGGSEMRIGVDLSAVTFISVRALHDLVTLANVQHSGRRIELLECSEPVLRLIEILGPHLSSRDVDTGR